MLKKLLREPLVHFLALALLIFIAYGALNRKRPRSLAEIVVTQARIEQIAGIFARTWQRPPSLSELKGLIDDYVKDEVYSREALDLGLDKDDTVIRRRLRQKMEFLSDAEIEALDPTEAELEEYLNSTSPKFAIDPAIAFSRSISTRSGAATRSIKMRQPSSKLCAPILRWIRPRLVTSLCCRPQLI